MTDHRPEPALGPPTLDGSTGDERVDAILAEAGWAGPVGPAATLDEAGLADLAVTGEHVRSELQRRLTDLDGE